MAESHMKRTPYETIWRTESERRAARLEAYRRVHDRLAGSSLLGPYLVDLVPVDSRGARVPIGWDGGGRGAVRTVMRWLPDLGGVLSCNDFVLAALEESFNHESYLTIGGSVLVSLWGLRVNVEVTPAERAGHAYEAADDEEWERWHYEVLLGWAAPDALPIGLG